MTGDNEFLPQQPSTRIKSANKRMLRRQTLYKATSFFFIAYITGMLIYAAVLPNTLHIERSIHINAPAEKVFEFISDYHQWRIWSPWEDNNSKLMRSYSGAGTGAIYVWQADNDSIIGRAEIIESTAPVTMVITLDIMQRFEAHHIVVFTLTKQNGTTLVTQSVSGSHSYASKLLGLCFDMNRIAGEKYMNGLARLKMLAEQSRLVTANTHGIHEH